MRLNFHDNDPSLEPLLEFKQGTSTVPPLLGPQGVLAITITSDGKDP